MGLKEKKKEFLKYSAILLAIYLTHITLAYLHSFLPHKNVIPPSQFEIKFVKFVSKMPKSLLLPWQILYYIGFPIFIISSVALIIYYGKGKSLAISYLLIVACSWLFYWVAVLYEPTYIGMAPKYMVMLPFIKNYNVTNFSTGPSLCFPSLHVATSVLLGLYMVGIGFKKYGTANAILISLSTLMTAQHWLRDVIGGTILAIGAFLIAEGVNRKL